MKTPHLFALFFVTATLLMQTVASAQQVTEDASAGGNSRKQESYIRVRVVAVGLQESVSVFLKDAPDDFPPFLESFVPSLPTTTPYEKIASRGKTIELQIGGKASSVTLDLLPSQFYTLLLFQKGSELETKLLQDSFPPEASSQIPLRIFNFGSSRSATIKIGDFPLINSSPSSFQEVSLPALGILPMQIVVPDPEGGYPALNLGEMDLEKGKGTSIFIMPDYRGKFRPRVWRDAVLE